MGSVCCALIEESRSFNSSVAELVHDFNVTAAAMRFKSAEDSLLFFKREVLAVPKMGRHCGKMSFSTLLRGRGSGVMRNENDLRRKNS